MKKVLLVFVFAFVAVSLFAADVFATTSEGKTVVLHSNGTWEYYYSNNSGAKNQYGKWGFSADSVNAAIEAMLVEYGIDPSSTMYAYYKSALMQSIESELDGIKNTILVLKEGGEYEATAYGETTIGTYSVDQVSLLLTIVVDDTPTPFGVFSDDFSKLYIMGMESLYFTKLDSNVE